MNKLLFILFFVFNGLSAQIYEFKTSGYVTSEKAANNTWSKWSNFKTSEILIQLDRNKHRFIVNAEILQIFEVFKYEEKVETDKEITNKYICIDGNGALTVITIVSPKDSPTLKQIFIAYDDLIFQYAATYIGER